MQIGDEPDELLPPFLPRETQQQFRVQFLSPQSPHISTVRTFAKGCHSLLDIFLITVPAELRHAPTVTFVRGVYAIKGLMLLQSAWMKSESFRRVLNDCEIQYQAYLEAMRQHLRTIAGDASCRVPTKVLELVTFLAEQDTQATQKGQHLSNNAAEQLGFPFPSAMPLQDAAAGFNAMSANVFPDSYLLGPYIFTDPHGSDVDMLQMPDLGDLSFLCVPEFNFDDTALQGGWNAGESAAIPSQFDYRTF